MAPFGPTAAPRHGRADLLIVEDDDALRESLVWMFEHSGYWATGVVDGSQFLEWTEPIILGERGHWLPDLILTDVVMPGIPPIQVVDALRHVGCHVPVVVISGLDDPHIRELVREMGAQWLEKPLDPRVINEVVRNTLVDPANASNLEEE